MKLKYGYIFFTFLAQCSYSLISAQSLQNDTNFTSMAVNNAINVYHQLLDRGSGLYNGPEYNNYPFRFEEGSPYFGGNDYIPGSVVYDGVLYLDIFMKYDQLKDVLIIRKDNNAIQLLSEKVSIFKLPDHSFTRILKDNNSGEPAVTGFYEQLYNGHIAVFKKVTKNILENFDMTNGILRSIDQKTYFYLLTNNRYILIKNKGDLIDALPMHKKETRKFIDSGNLNFKKDPADFIVKVATYYDSL
jgi:hypothetical protein